MAQPLQQFNELLLVRKLLKQSVKIDITATYQDFFLFLTTPVFVSFLFWGLFYFTPYFEILWGILATLSSVLTFFAVVGSCCFVCDKRCVLYKNKTHFYQKFQKQCNLDSITYSLILSLICKNGDLPDPNDLTKILRSRAKSLKNNLQDAEAIKSVAYHLATTDELYQQNDRNSLINELLTEHNQFIEKRNKEAQSVQKKMEQAGIELPQDKQPIMNKKLVISNDEQ